MKITISDISQLTEVTQQLIDLMDRYNIFLLKGDLGSGKTTLVKQWMADLGTKDLVSSPTFSIINEYHAKNKIIYHMDMYRLQSIDEALNIGIEEYIYKSDHYNIIEWPDLILNLIDESYIMIEICVDDNQRTFAINKIDQ